MLASLSVQLPVQRPSHVCISSCMKPVSQWQNTATYHTQLLMTQFCDREKMVKRHPMCTEQNSKLGYTAC
jgi:hypothetical protein